MKAALCRLSSFRLQLRVKGLPEFMTAVNFSQRTRFQNALLPLAIRRTLAR
jgi:hypothetical protein